MGKGKATLLLAAVLVCRPAQADMVMGGERLTAVLPSPSYVPAHVAPCTGLPWLAVYFGDIFPTIAEARSPIQVTDPPVRFATDALGTASTGRDGGVVELPPPPSGTSLTLSGLLTLGAMQIARSARQARLSALFQVGVPPEWYHCDAVQVGHVVPYGLGTDSVGIASNLLAIAAAGEPDWPLARIRCSAFLFPANRWHHRSPVVGPRSPPFLIET